MGLYSIPEELDIRTILKQWCKDIYCLFKVYYDEEDDAIFENNKDSITAQVEALSRGLLDTIEFGAVHNNLDMNQYIIFDVLSAQELMSRRIETHAPYGVLELTLNGNHYQVTLYVAGKIFTCLRALKHEDYDESLRVVISHLCARISAYWYEFPDNVKETTFQRLIDNVWEALRHSYVVNEDTKARVNILSALPIASYLFDLDTGFFPSLMDHSTNFAGKTGLLEIEKTRSFYTVRLTYYYKGEALVCDDIKYHYCPQRGPLTVTW